MFVAHISHLVPMDYRAAFPNVSFPASGPSDDFLTEQGFAKVSAFKDHDRATQKLVNVAAYYEAPWVYTVKVVDKTAEDIQAETDAQAASVRAQRNRLLADCDWTQLADSTADKAAWATYRQALRDITAQAGFPWTVTWPEQP